MKYLVLLLFVPIQVFSQKFTTTEITKWKQQAKQITIIRDKWGIAHVYGKTDADAVFGLLYAQCEDDFNRVEMNYIEKLGRMAEVQGESALYDDLLNRLVLDSAEAIKDFKNAQPWLKKLLQAYADGINFYIYKNPKLKPLLLKRFQPWYPLLWTDGSIGAISTGGLSINDLRKFYSGDNSSIAKIEVPEEELPSGSNGFAIGPNLSATGNPMLYINPHVTFYFRPEIHMSSNEGLNAYGAVTWGQFFIYQGFNEYCGWMHTSSAVDVADVYAETIVKKNNRTYYQYNNELKILGRKTVTLRYKSKTSDSIITKPFQVFYTHHGPIMGERDGKWLALKGNNRSMNGLIQSWQRTKAKGFADFKKVMNLRSNTSNNTVFADKSNIAYWHGNFVPRRDPKFDWSKPVDGSDSATEWKGIHTVDETIHIYNPDNGWIQNCNSTPYTAAGVNSPAESAFPTYMAPDGENFRGVNAVRVLSRKNSFSMNDLIAAGYDTYLSAFETLIPALIKAYDSYPENDSVRIKLKEPLELLRQWDGYSSENSVATTLAIEWGQRLIGKIQQTATDDDELDIVGRTKLFAAKASPQDLTQPFIGALNELNRRYNTWNMPWGNENRYQRLTGKVDEKFDDNAPSLGCGFAASTWGCLPSFVSRLAAGTKKRYGYNGNSFICAVEFGKKVKAKSLLAGGVSGNPSSKHFGDQAEMYTKGIFKDVLFYKEDVKRNAEKTYHPGDN